MSSGLEVRETEGRGRGTFATRAFAAGETVMRAIPAATAVCDDLVSHGRRRVRIQRRRSAACPLACCVVSVIRLPAQPPFVCLFSRLSRFAGADALLRLPFCG
eukprot:scaffold21150_cov129-Isochrysis_galbana.AAC.4